jgi:Virulence-associated protein E
MGRYRDAKSGRFLSDPTGERRYWHVGVRFYNREAFLADKNQLYAEAVVREPNENLWLDTPDLVKAHDAVVAGAKEPNELVDMLRDLRGEMWHVNGTQEERISAQDIRARVGLTPADAARSHNIGRRILEAMMVLGWTKAPRTLRCRPGEEATTGYSRPVLSGPPSGRTGPTAWTGATGTRDTLDAPTGPTGPRGPTSPASLGVVATLPACLLQGIADGQAALALFDQETDGQTPS